MLQYNEIKDIITNKYGYKTLDDWKKHVESITQTTTPRTPPTQEEIDLLSPDNVDCGAFWAVCTELFGIDPVCNISENRYRGYIDSSNINQYDITTANRRNLWLTETFGFLTHLKEFAQHPSAVMEFGVGYGNLKNWVETNTQKLYYGFDVNPLINGVQLLDYSGKIVNDTSNIRGTVSHFVCSNVFQHLSEKQRLYIFDVAAEYLHTGGLFMFNTPVKTAHCSYMSLYGQFTINPESSWIEAELNKRGLFFHMVNSRWDGVVGYIVIKK